VSESNALSIAVSGNKPSLVTRHVCAQLPQNVVGSRTYAQAHLYLYQFSPPHRVMALQSERALSLPHLGGKSAVILFITTLIAFVVESQLTQVSLLFCLSISVSHPCVYKVCAKHSSLSASILPLVSPQSGASPHRRIPLTYFSPVATSSILHSLSPSLCIFYTLSSRRLRL
jgi:hypothetical protein